MPLTPSTQANQCWAMNATYDANCRRCPRLAGFLDEVHNTYPEYFCRPVPAFGDEAGRLLVVGLAPGMHGANASGRPFTGDWCGPLLYSSLYRFGFASKSESLHRNDDLKLIDCRLTNAVKCLPPQNKPVLSEIRTCGAYLTAELHAMRNLRVVLALGLVAHQAVVEASGARLAAFPFAHGRWQELPNGLHLVDSYHVSRYNTNTGRLTETMFHAVLANIREKLGVS